MLDWILVCAGLESHLCWNGFLSVLDWIIICAGMDSYMYDTTEIQTLGTSCLLEKGI